MKDTPLLNKSVFVFDFDKTITNGLLEGRKPNLKNLVRGGDKTIQVLLQLLDKNVPLCILTARKATKQDLDSVKQELQEIDAHMPGNISQGIFLRKFK